ncbi:hypothetical protein TIFTF001_049448 [Ficus carica]|uniref:Uncharacterized protein n=2 Tax=Ficus carica TaxID=3494 RepID=A0AA87Z203_FICCA|nr:hypothetical protein TIFTF001_049447 [Ficus carica]GMN28332.1 hypothetical protein TIFTF001_049448 [Ficus carica]
MPSTCVEGLRARKIRSRNVIHSTRRGCENADNAQTHDGENANNQPPPLGLILGQNSMTPNFAIDEARLSTVIPVSINLPSATAMWPSKMGRQRQLRMWRVRVGGAEDRKEVGHRSWRRPVRKEESFFFFF